MSRKSYGYSSYRSRSYGSYSYGRHRRGNDNKKKIIIVIVCICVLLAAGAVGAGVYFGVFGNFTAEPEASQAQSADTPSKQKTDTSKQVSETSKNDQESSAASSAPSADLKGEFDGNVFVYDRQGYEIFYGSAGIADKYAQTVASIKKSLGKDINVYNLTAPTHSLYGLPEKYQDLGADEKQNIKSIYDSLGSDVKTIDVTSTLEKHKDEYIYFKTDHNWTALGAYYAYCDFCASAGVKAVDIKTLSEGRIENFQGSLIAATKTDTNKNGNKLLQSNPDTVKYYTMPGNYTCMLLENGKKEAVEVPLIASFAEGSNAYSAFIWGSNPYMDIKTDLKTGRKLCIITDSYGCAFAPYTVADFDEIYIVDPRYYSGNIIDYIKKNKYTDVLVINSVMTANTEIRTNELKTILK